jgi:hypothetical protein
LAVLELRVRCDPVGVLVRQNGQLIEIEDKIVIVQGFDRADLDTLRRRQRRAPTGRATASALAGGECGRLEDETDAKLGIAGTGKRPAIKSLDVSYFAQTPDGQRCR